MAGGLESVSRAGRTGKGQVVVEAVAEPAAFASVAKPLPYAISGGRRLRPLGSRTGAPPAACGVVGWRGTV